MTARDDAARAVMEDCLNKDLPQPCGIIYPCMCREHADRALTAALVVTELDVVAATRAYENCYFKDRGDPIEAALKCFVARKLK